MVEHKFMARAFEKKRDSKHFPFSGEPVAVVSSLETIAQSVTDLQGNRHVADYDNSTFWAYTEALEEVTTAATDSSFWHSIRNEKIAQDFLISLLIRPRSLPSSVLSQPHWYPVLDYPNAIRPPRRTALLR